MSRTALPDVRFRSEQEIEAEASPTEVMEATRIDPSIVSTTHARLIRRLGHLGESLSYIEKLDMVTRMYAIHWEVRHGRSHPNRSMELWLLRRFQWVHLKIRSDDANRLRAVPGTECWMRDLGQEVQTLESLAEKANACAERIQEIMKRRPVSYEKGMARIEEAPPNALWRAARFLATLPFCLLAWPQR